jgi:hypothetical protein
MPWQSLRSCDVRLDLLSKKKFKDAD